MRCSPANIKSKDMAKFDAKKADLNKDGQLSDYEKNRGKATAAAMQMSKGYNMQMGKDKSGIDSSHSFPMKQAYTIRMSPMLQTTDEEGLPQDIESKTIAMPSGALATQTDVTSSFEIPGTTTTRKKTWDDLRAEGFTEEQIKEAKAWRKANPDVKNVGVTETTPPTTETKTETAIDPKITQTKGLTALGQRKDARAGLVLARNIGKMEKKIARAKRKDERKGTTSAKTTALERELQNLKNKSKARGEQSDQGFAGTQTYNIDVIGTPEQRKQLATSGKSTYDTSNLLAMPGSSSSNEFGRFGYQAGSMLENIAMPMMKFKGKKSGYKK
jgi:hypothetical protein